MINRRAPEQGLLEALLEVILDSCVGITPSC